MRGYRLHGEDIREMPATFRALEAVEPVYEMLPGWRCSTRGIDQFDKLPDGEGECTSPDVRWFGLGQLPTNMLDRSRVALRNYAEGMRFSTYPAFGPVGVGGIGGHALANAAAAPWQDAFSA